MPYSQVTIRRMMLAGVASGAIVGVAAPFVMVGGFRVHTDLMYPLIAFIILLGIGIVRALTIPGLAESTDCGRFSGMLSRGQMVETRLEVAVEGRSISVGTACQVLRDDACSTDDCQPTRRIGVHILEGPLMDTNVLVERIALRHKY
jgi:hypothetical protein